MPRRNRIVRLVTLTLFATASSAAWAQTTGWTVAPPFNSNSPTGVQGTEFTPGPDILVTDIGWFDDTAASPDGLAVAHEVGIFNAATMSLIVSATIPAGTGAPKIDEFRFAPIAPLQLAGGVTYVIAGVADGDPGHVTLGGAGLTVDPDLTLGDWRSEPGTALTFPTTVVSSTDLFMGANILFAPVPLPDACAAAAQLDCDTVIGVNNGLASRSTPPSSVGGGGRTSTGLSSNVVRATVTSGSTSAASTGIAGRIIASGGGGISISGRTSISSNSAAVKEMSAAVCVGQN